MIIERQVSTHFEGVPFYGVKSDISGPDISNRLVRSKRSSSDSVFMGSSAREGMAQIGPESHENMHLMKVVIGNLLFSIYSCHHFNEKGVLLHFNSLPFIFHPPVD